jgi:hypothetical protein
MRCSTASAAAAVDSAVAASAFATMTSQIRYRELNLLLQATSNTSGDTCEQDHHLQSPKRF